MTALLTAQEAEQAAARVMARCDALAAISATPGQLTRTYLSPEHRRANLLVGDWMRSIGMEVWQDGVGNICGRYEARRPAHRRCCSARIWIRCATPGVTTACSAY